MADDNWGDFDGFDEGNDFSGVDDDSIDFDESSGVSSGITDSFDEFTDFGNEPDTLGGGAETSGTPSIDGKFSGRFNGGSSDTVTGDGKNKMSSLVSENKKTAIMGAAIGFAIILVVIFVVTRIGGNKEAETSARVNRTVVGGNTSQSEGNIVVNDNNTEVNSGNTQVEHETPQINNKTSIDNGETDNGWKAVSNNESVTWSSELETQTFTVTKVDSFARAVDASDSLDMKTVASGSISGYGGTYQLELPYKLGSQLQRGDKFEVYVYTGDYKGRTVVGGMEYLQR